MNLAISLRGLRWSRVGLAFYVGLFVFYLLNLSAPPDNMPIFILMAVVAGVMLFLRKDKKYLVFCICLVVMAIALIFKEHHDGIVLKKKIDAMRQHSVSVAK